MNTAKDKARIKKWVADNPERSRAIKRKYKEANREKVRAYNWEYAKRYRQKYPTRGNEWPLRSYHSNAQFKLSKCIRSVMTRAFRRLAKGQKIGCTMTLLGCSIEELRIHIQSQFKPGMAWNNYRFQGWHIDHIRPISSFDLFDPEEQKKAFHYTNLQPLWAEENFSKNDHYDQRR